MLGKDSYRTEVRPLSLAAKAYGNFVRDMGRQTDNKRKIFHLLNELSIIERFVLDAPLMVGVDVIANCNLSCQHCFRDQDILPYGHRLNTEEILKIIDDLDEIGVIETYITGGEPFLRKDIIDIIRRIKQYNMMTNIHSNGTQITTEHASALAALLQWDSDFIQISIDGAEQTHNIIRGSDCYQITVSGLLRLVEAGAPTRINMVVNDANFREMVDVYELAAVCGVKEVSFSPMLRTRFNGIRKLPADTKLLLEFDRVLQVAEMAGNPVKITQDPIAVPCGNSLLAPEIKKHIGKPRYVCPAGSSAIEIDAKGDVYPCPYLHYPEFGGGNVKSASLSEIWQAAGWQALRGSKSLSSCGSCEFSDGCGGACAAQAFHERGSIDGPDTRCERLEGAKA